MEIEQRAACPENDALVEYMQKWWTEMSKNNPKTYTHNTEKTIQKALNNVCKHKTPITTLKEFKDIKGIGKWFVTNMREFFNSNSFTSQDDDLEKEGKKARGSKSYLPQKNSVAYALLISLYRGTTNGIEFMHKQELIDAAEASGLARVPIVPEKGRGKPGAFGSSPKEWYSGWSAMGKLIDKGLVYKTSCPAKYMLSDAGRRVAIECISRSGVLDSVQNVVNTEETSDSDDQDAENVELVSSDILTFSDQNTRKGMKDDIPMEFLERFTNLGFTREQVLRVLAEVSKCSSPETLSTIWPTVLCRLREDAVFGSRSGFQATVRRDSGDASTSYEHIDDQRSLTNGIIQNGCTSFRSIASPLTHVTSLIPCSSLGSEPLRVGQDVLRLPPLEDVQNFEDAYNVVLILDDREHFIRTKSRQLIEKICDEFKIQIETRRLPVGDAIWIARHKQAGKEYILDFIVERKNVDDLRGSIRDNRYKDQKLRLQRTGIKKIMYVVEGDPNTCEGADSIKTACFTTEILEGFDVQRTSSLGDTLRCFGFLTLAITEYYKLKSRTDESKTVGSCPVYNQFIKQCEDVDKMTVSDVFATQLMQVPLVTEDIALAVLHSYPTLYSLARAYADLDEDIVAQEELLMKESKGVVNKVASRNIFRFVWT
ncbi:crossover junction endonuclease MUS81 isoform X2 [Amaranthus tricolor]|uniref:crossover junction endonuclease MUS81 isoform X2 n=1 Tax=Amaranthus tricolor TaxID=29722 RepID=UPI002589A3CA|nr:crossover junction endonuclease MUS81 isoform X2 [Amaranthus tricolor]